MSRQQPNDRLTELRRTMHERLGGSDCESVRGPRTAVVIGRVLGLTFVVCFVTGLFSHFLQDPMPWMRFPTRPAVFYQFTQGVHVASGLMSVPLLLAKLWTVYPGLFVWPPITSGLHAVERGLIGVLVSASLVELTIGVMNIYHWYAWPFSFRTVHYGLAWIIVGSLLTHIAFQLPMIRIHWRAHHTPRPIRTADGRLVDAERRIFLASVATAVTAITVFTVGQSTRFLSGLNFFGPRHYGGGPQGLPVNRTATAAGVLSAAADPGWILEVRNGAVVHGFRRAELQAMGQTSAVIPIACVEGWSTSAKWTGVRIRDLLAQAGFEPHSRLRITSLQTRGGYAVSEMGPEFTSDDLTLIALEVNGQTLDLDHGYPARIIAPGRPGVLQTKWISSIEVLG